MRVVPFKRMAPPVIAAMIFASSAYSLSPDRAVAQYGHVEWTSQDGLPGEAVYEILQTADGYLWMRTSSGLVRFDGMRFVRIDPSVDKVPFGESVRAICRGANGEMLVRGMSKTLAYRDGVFTNYLPAVPLPDGSTRRVFETREHQLWIGGDDFIYRLNAGRMEMIRRGTSWVDAFLQDRQGNLWIGGERALYRYSHEVLAVEPSPQPGLSFLSFLEDHQGGLWIGTSKGLYRMANGVLVPAAAADEVIHDQVSAILEDRHGNIWVGTSNSGLHRLSGGRWTSFTHVSGLSDDAILSLAEDREGDLWVGTASGLDQFRDVNITGYTKAEGLLSNNTTSVLVNHSGEIYVFSQGAGLTRLKDGVATGFTRAHLGLRRLAVRKQGWQSVDRDGTGPMQIQRRKVHDIHRRGAAGQGIHLCDQRGCRKPDHCNV
jgi:Two component regulator propeller